MDDLAEWVHKAREGDEQGYRELYRRFSPAAHRVARSMGSLGRAEVEDVVQEAFIRAFSKLSALKDDRAFAVWFLTIVRNVALAASQSERRRVVRTGRASRDDEPITTLFSDAYQLEVDANAVREVIRELPEGPERQTAEAFYIDGRLSARELAEQLGVGKSAVTMRLERFRGRIKRVLLQRLLKNRLA